MSEAFRAMRIRGTTGAVCYLKPSKPLMNNGNNSADRCWSFLKRESTTKSLPTISVSSLTFSEVHEAETTPRARFCHVNKFEVTSWDGPKLVYYKSSPSSVLTWTTSPLDVPPVWISHRTKPSLCPITLFKILSTASGRPGLNRTWAHNHLHFKSWSAFYQLHTLTLTSILQTTISINLVARLIIPLPCRWCERGNFYHY